MNFKIVAYDKQTHGDFPAAMMNNDYRVISVLQGETTWRELTMAQKSIIAALHAMDVDGMVIELMVINDIDRVAFPLRDILPEKGAVNPSHPAIVAERYHTNATTTNVRISREEIRRLLECLPATGKQFSGLRDRLIRGESLLNAK